MGWESMTGMTGMSGTTEGVSSTGSSIQPAAPEAGSKWKDFAKQAGEQLAKGGGGGGSSGAGGDPGSGSTLAAKRPIGEHPEASALDDSPARQGFARLAEIPGRQRTYGNP